MKILRLWLLAVATMLVPLSAHADYFELKLKATCFDLNAGKFTVQKRKLSTQAFIAKVMNIAPEDAAGLTLLIGPADGSINVAVRCDRTFLLGLAASRVCKDVEESVPDLFKYARTCTADVNDFAGAVVRGSLLCTLQGKTDTGLGPIAAKGSCVGSFNTDAMEFCRIDGAIGKRFVEKGPCVK